MNKDKFKEALKDIKGIDNITFIGKDTSFNFKCDMCGKCCTANTIATILLKPYDLYKIAKAKNIECENILKKEYAETYIGETSGFPVVRMLPNSNGQCHFLKMIDNRGLCEINDNKPGSCSLYPLGRAIENNKETNNMNLIYFLQDINCGLKEENSYTLNSWLGNHKENEEAALFKEMDLINELNNTIDLNKLYKTYQSYGKNRTISHLINIYYNNILGYYYFNYNIKEDFLSQLDKNIDKIIKITKGIMCALYCYLKYSYLGNGKEIISLLFVDDFEEEYKDDINYFINEFDNIALGSN